MSVVSLAAVGECQSAGADSLPPSYYNDGPHVYWYNDSTAVVIYMCDGERDTTWFAAGDTLRFRGRCDDAAIAYAIPRTPPSPPPAVYNDVGRLLVVSDLHGEYERLTSFLQHAKVIDKKNHWKWGDGHLVVDGDIVDRGNHVTECLWLIYRLDQEAQRAGGRVHVLLGNHDVMVMRNDLRYVNEKYTNGVVRKSRIDYDDLFGPDMELGRWLRTRNTVERINGVLFVHGGISPSCVARELTIDAINDTVRALIDVSSAQEATDPFTRFLFGGEGPFWYRGYHYEMENRYPRASDTDVTAILAYYGASAVVVGHTEVPVIESMYDGRVYGVDVPVEDLGTFQGLLWENGKFSRVRGDGSIDRLD